MANQCTAKEQRLCSACGRGSDIDDEFVLHVHNKLTGWRGCVSELEATGRIPHNNVIALH